MNTSTEPERDDLEDARQIQRWTRRYAQNRSLPVALALVVFAMLFLAIGLSSLWAGIAYRSGNITLFAVCVGVAIVGILATFYVSVPRWGGRRLQQLGEKLYEAEGRATIDMPRARQTWLLAAIAIAFGTCVAGQVILGVIGYLPTGKYAQPISALYMVPFLVAMNFLMRPGIGNVPLVWPVLYALHAILIVAGAPIVFDGKWEPLNMLLPTIGYGLVTAIVGHIYSRWALHSVRVIVGRQLDDAQLEQNGGPA
jgi:hypothetical protein